MISEKIKKIARSTNRSYRSAKRRVEVLAPVCEGVNVHQRLDTACNQILDKIAVQDMVFRNVNFLGLYKDIV